MKQAVSLPKVQQVAAQISTANLLADTRSFVAHKGRYGSLIRDWMEPADNSKQLQIPTASVSVSMPAPSLIVAHAEVRSLAPPVGLESIRPVLSFCLGNAVFAL